MILIVSIYRTGLLSPLFSLSLSSPSIPKLLTQHTHAFRLCFSHFLSSFLLSSLSHLFTFPSLVPCLSINQQTLTDQHSILNPPSLSLSFFSLFIFLLSLPLCLSTPLSLSPLSAYLSHPFPLLLSLSHKLDLPLSLDLSISLPLYLSPFLSPLSLSLS
jgi:hypothetical protein